MNLIFILERQFCISMDVKKMNVVYGVRIQDLSVCKMITGSLTHGAINADKLLGTYLNIRSKCPCRDGLDDRLFY